MIEQQIPVELVEIKDKVIVLKGDEFDQHFMENLKQHLKKKGFEPAAIMILPDHHHVFGLAKKELIADLKSFIKRLEEE